MFNLLENDLEQISQLTDVFAEIKEIAFTLLGLRAGVDSLSTEVR